MGIFSTLLCRRGFVALLSALKHCDIFLCEGVHAIRNNLFIAVRAQLLFASLISDTVPGVGLVYISIQEVAVEEELRCSKKAGLLLVICPPPSATNQIQWVDNAAYPSGDLTVLSFCTAVPS